MLRITQNTFKTLKNVINDKTRITFDKRSYRAIIRIPDSYNSKAYYSQGN